MIIRPPGHPKLAWTHINRLNQSSPDHQKKLPMGLMLNHQFHQLGQSHSRVTSPGCSVMVFLMASRVTPSSLEWSAWPRGARDSPVPQNLAGFSAPAGIVQRLGGQVAIFHRRDLHVFGCEIEPRTFEFKALDRSKGLDPDSPLPCQTMALPVSNVSGTCAGWSRMFETGDGSKIVGMTIITAMKDLW